MNEVMRVVIADDHALVRDSMTKLLEGEGDFDLVGQAATGVDAVATVLRLEPDIVVLDVSMPGDLDGLDAAARIRDEAPDTRIVMLTMVDDADALERASHLAVDGYVPKTAPLDEVLAALRSVAAGTPYVSSEIAVRMMRMASGGRQPHSLTERETEILTLLARGERIQDIAATLFLSDKTVKHHLTNVYTKLGVATAAQAVATAYRTGIVRVED